MNTRDEKRCGRLREIMHSWMRDKEKVGDGKRGIDEIITRRFPRCGTSPGAF